MKTHFLFLLVLFSGKILSQSTYSLKSEADSIDLVFEEVQDSFKVALKDYADFYSDQTRLQVEERLFGCSYAQFHSTWLDYRNGLTMAKANLYEGGSLFIGVSLYVYLEETENRIRYLRDFTGMIE